MCDCDRELFARRRAAFCEAMTKAGHGEAVAVLPSSPVFPRNSDVEHEYRQDSDLFYVTGFDEPQSALVLGASDQKSTLFVRPRDPEREIWDGPRAGVDGAKATFGADESHVIRELEEQLPKLLQNKRRLYYRLGRDRSFDDQVLQAIDRTRARARLGVSWPTEIVDPGELIHEMRLYKDAADLEAMKRAADITKEAHLRAMARARPGMNEYEVEALLLETFRKHGSVRAAYHSIVGSGSNATILHYIANNREMRGGELLLIDAGCEYGYFASDVTRTFPVSGKFSREQQAIYELVLEAQAAGIEATRPGATLEEIHKGSVRTLTEGLVRLGLLSGDV